VLASAAAGCNPGGADNRPPAAAGDRVATDEDIAVELDPLANDSDPDGDALSLAGAQVVGSPIGQASIVGARALRFEPLANAHGSTVVRYTVTDRDQSATADIAIEVHPVNDTPTATPAALTTGRNEPVALPLAGLDVDGDALRYEIRTAPGSGTLSREGEVTIYTPHTDFAGGDRIEFVAVDAEATSPLAAIDITVLPGASPVATPQRVTTAEDTPLAIELAATDDDDHALQFRVAWAPRYGRLTGTPPQLTYTPNEDYHGVDSFAFVASDAQLVSVPAQVTIVVTPVNDLPVAIAATATTTEDTPVAIALRGDDRDGDALAFTVARQPAHGTLSGAAPALRYRPAADFDGDDSFAFTVADGTATTEPAEVRIAVAAVNDLPEARDSAASTDEDTPVAIALVGADREGAVSFTIERHPRRGSLAGTAPSLVYTPFRDDNGDDSFAYKITDSEGATATATVSLTIRAINDAPRLLVDRFNGDEDSDIRFKLELVDPEGDDVWIPRQRSQPSHGIVGWSDGDYYRPNRDFYGADAYDVDISDYRGATRRVTVRFEVRAVDDPPIALPDLARTEPDTTVDIDALANDQDPEGSEVRLIGIDAPLLGTASVVAGVVRYAPAAGYAGTTRLTYRVADDGGRETRGTITVGVGEFPRAAPMSIVPDDGKRNARPQLSADGRFVAFDRSGDAATQIMVYDRLTGDLDLVSARPDGRAASAASTLGGISADGRFIVFASEASDLVTDDGNAASDVFVRDRAAGITERVSVANNGREANGRSTQPSISADGRLVSFTSSAFNLVTNDVNGSADVFVRDRTAGTTVRVSLRANGGEADGHSAQSALSADGSTIAFSSSATNIVAGDDNESSDIFVRDLERGTVERASVSSTGAAGAGPCFVPSLSAEGRFVAFYCEDRVLVPGDALARAVYVRDRETGNTSLGAIGHEGGALSGDGRFLIVDAGNSVVVRDRFANESHTVQLSTGARAGVAISADGASFAFATAAPVLTSDRDDRIDIYVDSNPFLP
jgi:Tol biopolymer transport system component